MLRSVPISLLLTAVLVGGAAEGRAVKMSDIPSPRPDGWVTDLTGRIPPDTLGKINRLGNEIKAQTKSEIAVAVVDDVNDVNTRGFATRLFHRWGIGRRGSDDGVLIFISLDGHRAEIILGSGIDAPGRRRISEEILRTEIAPLLREGDAAGALLAGMQGCARRVLEIQAAAPAASASVSSVVTGFLAVLAAFCLFLFFTRRAPAPWPGHAGPVRSARDDGNEGDGGEEPSLLQRTG
jgi:uncharacterized membrane protein YgcG